MKKNCCSQERTGLRDQTRCQEIANQILKHGVDEAIRFGQMTMHEPRVQDVIGVL